jgi:hypothetical protein
LKFILTTVVISTLILFSAAVAAGQTYRGTVRGTVYDPNHAVVPGAKIVLTEVATGITRTASSGNEGEYDISSLRPGTYEVAVESPNFLKYRERIELHVNQDQRVDVTLEVGGDPVEVNSTFDATLQKDSASQGAIIENRQVVGLPLDGRNFYELTLLVPGVSPPAQGSAGSVRGDFAFSVNGAREDSNNFLLDGVYNVDPETRTFAVRPSVDAIREFENLTSTPMPRSDAQREHRSMWCSNPAATICTAPSLSFIVTGARCQELSSFRQAKRSQIPAQPVWLFIGRPNPTTRSSSPTMKARVRVKALRA